MQRKLTVLLMTALMMVSFLRVPVIAEDSYDTIYDDICMAYDGTSYYNVGGMIRNGTEKSTGITSNGDIIRYLEGGTKMVIRPKITYAGKYRIMVWNAAHTSNEEYPKIDLYINGSATNLNGINKKILNHKTGPVGYVDLGVYDFPAGDSAYMEIMTGGFYVFDVVNFELVEPAQKIEYYERDFPWDTGESEYATRTIPAKEVDVPTVKEGVVNVFVENGKTGGDGSQANPFGTLTEAQTFVRSLIAQGYPENGIAVNILPGTYMLDGTFTLTGQDSGTLDAPVFYRAYQGGVTLTTAKVLDQANIIPISDEVKKILHPDGRDHIRAIDLVACGVNGISFVESSTIPFILSSEQNSFTTSRYPNGQEEDKAGVVVEIGNRKNKGGKRLRGQTFTISNPRQIRWENELNPMVSGMFGAEYQRISTPLADINSTDMTMSFKNDCQIEVTERASYYGYNLLSEIDEQGEFFVDTENSILYYYPYEKDTSDLFFVSNNSDLLSFNGASNIVFENISLTAGGGTGITMSPDSSHITVMGGSITNMAVHGAVIKGNDNTLRDYDITNIAGKGIDLYGGDSYKYIKGNNVVENNIIHDVGSGGSSSGISVSGCGNIARHNHVYNIPYIGINIGGNGNRVEYNRVERTCVEMTDLGGIYFLNYGMGYGTEINYNLVRDVIGGKKDGNVYGIYVDDYSSGISCTGNVLVRTKRTPFFIKGRNTTLTNNLAVADNYVVGFDRHSVGDFARNQYDENGLTLEQRNILKHDIYNVPEFALAVEDIESQDQGLIINQQLRNNVIYNMNESTKENELDYQQNKMPLYKSSAEGMTYIDGLPDCDQNTLEDLDFAEIKALCPTFQELDIASMGIYSGGMRKNTDDVIVTNCAESFDLSYPHDGEKNVGVDLTLKWLNGLENLGHFMYKLYVFEDPEMQHKILEMPLRRNNFTYQFDYGKTYYWMVEATAHKTGDKIVNRGGLHSFTTVSSDVLFDRALFKAKTLVKDTEGKEGDFCFPFQAKEELLNLIREAETGGFTTEEEKNEMTTKLTTAAESYIEKRNTTQNMATLFYTDFSTDCIDAHPYSAYLQQVSDVPAWVKWDPKNAMNKVLEITDDNRDGAGSPYSSIASQNTSYIMYQFKRQTSNVEISARVMVRDLNSCYSMGLSNACGHSPVKDSPSANNLASINFHTDGKIYGDKNKKYPLKEYSTGEWYNIKMVVRADDGVYDAYVDGELLASDIPLYKPVNKSNVSTHMGQLIFSATDGTEDENIRMKTGVYYLDDILVRAPSENGDNSYLSSLSINGTLLSDFIIDKYTYFVDMTAEELKNAVIHYECDANATVTTWDKDGYKYLIVLSGSKNASTVYTLKSKD